MTNQPPPQPGSWPNWLLTAVKGLTFTNVAVIILLVLIAMPTYLIYRIINDQMLLDRLMSGVRRVSAQQSPCSVAEIRFRGDEPMWTISTGFAYQGSDRYALVVSIIHSPTIEEIYSYCEALALVVDYMRDPDANSPTFPGTDHPIVRKYPPG